MTVAELISALMKHDPNMKVSFDDWLQTDSDVTTVTVGEAHYSGVDMVLIG